MIVLLHQSRTDFSSDTMYGALVPLLVLRTKEARGKLRTTVLPTTEYMYVCTPHYIVYDIRLPGYNVLRT